MEDFKEQANGVRHIPSKYSKEMATKSNVVSYNIRNGIQTHLQLIQELLIINYILRSFIAINLHD